MRKPVPAAAVISLLLAAGCTAAPAASSGEEQEPPPQPASQGPELRLRVGQSAQAGDSPLRVEFAGVDGDSRCAKGETCIWEGSAAVRLTVTGARGSQAVTLQTSTRAGPAAAAYDGWVVRLLSLEPHPVSGRPIAAGDYVVTLSVSRETTQ